MIQPCTDSIRELRGDSTRLPISFYERRKILIPKSAKSNTENMKNHRSVLVMNSNWMQKKNFTFQIQCILKSSI